MAKPERVADWISDLSADKRHCKLLSHNCVATFDITPESIAPLATKILDALAGPETELGMCRCDSIDIGLYGPEDVRAWTVHTGI